MRVRLEDSFYLCGSRPTGSLHIAHYISFVHPMLDLIQKREKVLMLVADYHAMFGLVDSDSATVNVDELLKSLFAFGIPEKNIVVSSLLRYEPELLLLMSNFIKFSELKYIPSIKDKDSDTVQFSNFLYPCLMAIDVLALNAHTVIVGQDQLPHIEFCKLIYDKINIKYNNIFNIRPQAKINRGIIKGIDGRKMSKSSKNTIEIFANENEIKKQIFSIQTSDNTSDFIPGGTTILSDIVSALCDIKLLNPDIYKLSSYAEIKQTILQNFLKYFYKARQQYTDIDTARFEIYKKRIRRNSFRFSNLCKYRVKLLKKNLRLFKL